MNLFVGNLSSDVTTEDLKQLFAEFGNIVNARIIFDPTTNTPRGFGFVEYSDKGHAFDAIDNLDMTYFMGQIISVKEAKSKTGDTRGGGGFNRGGSGGGFNRDNRSGGGQGYGGGQRREGGGGGSYNRDNRSNSGGGYQRREGGYGNSQGSGGGGSYNRDRGNWNNTGSGNSGQGGYRNSGGNYGNNGNSGSQDNSNQNNTNPTRQDDNIGNRQDGFGNQSGYIKPYEKDEDLHL